MQCGGHRREQQSLTMSQGPFSLQGTNAKQYKYSPFSAASVNCKCSVQSISPCFSENSQLLPCSCVSWMQVGKMKQLGNACRVTLQHTAVTSQVHTEKNILFSLFRLLGYPDWDTAELFNCKNPSFTLKKI